MMVNLSPVLQRVLASAARLQEVVPDAVLVGGSAAALHAGHRDSFDHDHVLSDLVDRYEVVLEAVEATEGWATSVRASKPPFTIMGRLGGVEAGLRQMRRTRPLETFEVDVGEGAKVVAPTAASGDRCSHRWFSRWPTLSPATPTSSTSSPDTRDWTSAITAGVML